MLNESDDQVQKTYLRSIKSFAVRNRTLTGIKQQMYQDGYRAWGLDHQQAADSSSPCNTWNYQQIFGNNNPVILEIGFGNGETLIKNAKNKPDHNYIGVEVYQKGVWNILVALDALKTTSQYINNLRVCQADVKLALDCIPHQALAGIQIFFPDPWRKSRHHKRRLIQTEFIDSLVPKIKTGGFIHLATDWADYANHMKKVMDAHPDFKQSDFEQEEIRLETKYERRGLRHGHAIVDLKYIKLIKNNT